MPFRVVLDTCALYPANLRDTLLRLAERELYQPVWSEDILDELRRSLAKASINLKSIAHLISEMKIAFPHASTTEYQELIQVMTCDPKDRHVLAVAVHANAAAIVTFNTRDFPAPSVAPYNIDVIDTQDFLLDLLDLAPRIVLDELNQQVEANQKHPKSVPTLLGLLAKSGLAKFADEVYRIAQESGMYEQT